MQTKLTRTDDLMHYLEGKYLVYFHDAELYIIISSSSSSSSSIFIYLFIIFIQEAHLP